MYNNLAFCYFTLLEVLLNDLLKSKLDNFTMTLNHLLVVIVSLGAGLTKMLVDKAINNWFDFGLYILLNFVIIYGVIFFRKIDLMKGYKNDIT